MFFHCGSDFVFVSLLPNPKYQTIMTNYEYILSESKRAHYGAWSEKTVAECIQRLNGLTRDELIRLLTSRWLLPKDEVRKAVSRTLFHERLEQRDTMIREATIDELGAMLVEKNGTYVKLARTELKKRYQESGHDTQMAILRFFIHAAAKQDKKWGEVREKWQKRGFANPPSIFESWKK